VPWTLVVVVGPKAYIDHTIEKQKPRPLFLICGVKGKNASGAVAAAARDRGLNQDWAAELLPAGRDVDRMESKYWDASLGLIADQVHRIGGQIDYWRSPYSAKA
jgi:hypothetical protein